MFIYFYSFLAGNELGLFKLERNNNSEGIIKAAARIDREMYARQLLTVKCFKYRTKPKLNKAYNKLVSAIIAIFKIFIFRIHFK